MADEAEMNGRQELRLSSLSKRLGSLGYWISSEPTKGQVDGWLDGIERRLVRIEDRLSSTNRAYQCRGRSKAARYYLTSSESFDPGFGIKLTQSQRDENAAYAAELALVASRWDIINGD